MNNQFHEIRFPGESEKYRNSRNELLKAEMALRTQIEATSKLRKALPTGGQISQDYQFEEEVEVSGEEKLKQVKLSELFAEGKDSLIVYSFMYSADMKLPCTSCTSILDSLDGASSHVNQRTNLVVVAKSPIKRIQKWAKNRGWRNLRVLSSEKNTYNQDYFAESPEGGQWPACNVFVKTKEGICHYYSTELLYVRNGDFEPRHVDHIWPLWNLFDMIPEGRGSDWHPKLSYD